MQGYRTDQQRHDTIHTLGNEHIQTPNLDRLVREGVSFTHAHCQSPSCTPSRASFLTGLYMPTLYTAREMATITSLQTNACN